MINVFQLLKSEILRPVESPTSTQYWMAVSSDGSEDDTAMAAAVDLTLPVFDPFGTPIQDWRAEYLGGGVWTITVQYGEVPPLNVGITIWETDQSPTHAKLYQSMKTVGQQSATSLQNTPLIDFAGAINVTDESVEGADAPIGNCKWTAKRRYVSASLPVGYFQTLENLCNPRPNTNQAIFTFIWQSQTFTYQIGEALFMGFRASEVSLTRVEIDYYFEMHRNIAATTLQGFDATVAKNGHELAWVALQKSTSNGKVVKKPIQYNREQIFPAGDFSVLQL